MGILIADSGSTKCEWCFIVNGRKQIVETQGASPYFLNGQQFASMMREELLPALKNKIPSAVYFYGTGLGAIENRRMFKKAIQSVFPGSAVEVEHDLTGAAR